jgi:glutamyl-tRNA synthetase
MTARETHKSQLLVSRLAPSPTGALHLGNARTFLLAWLSARSRGGTILMRVENLDGPRVKARAEAQALDDLRWLGLDWDGEIVRQSDRVDRYQESIARLVSAGQAYPCVCTRSEVETAASAPNLGDAETRYPGTCRGRYASLDEAQQKSGRPAALRFVVSPGIVAFDDGFAGPQAFDPSAECGDFVIEKVERSGPKLGQRTPAYQLACVVDDADMGITEVFRGDDLLPSTARQILLQRALGLPAPRWIHTPLLVGEDGRRLAKRHGDTTIRRLREAGVPANRVVGWLVKVSGLLGNVNEKATFATRDAAGTVNSFTPGELVSRFSLDRVPQGPVVVRADTVGDWIAGG